MNYSSSVHLRSLNSFAVDSTCHYFYEPTTIEELRLLAADLPTNFYILGEGTNTLFIDETAPTIIKPNFRGIDIVESDTTYIITAAASENWHELVLQCVDAGIGGLENLALIPGSVGAAPVQNIGAYGAEIAECCREVHWFSFDDLQEIILTKKECKFGYRDSIFKGEYKNRGVITKVCLELPKSWRPRLAYSGLDELPTSVTLKAVMNKVIEIRQAKLPDPAVLPNAGSFFKNPIIKLATFERLKSKYSDIPHFQAGQCKVKLAAGWLIEQAGLKGLIINGCGVHKHQALVLVNICSSDGKAIIELAKEVSARVLEKFGVQLEPEVRLISKDREVTFDEVSVND
jgi:UDP-N-acetylmuramate dehydrogenase